MMILCPHCHKPFIQVKHKVTGATLRERFMQFVYEAPNGCWIWMGGHGKKGYPHFNHGNKTHYAHRVSLELHLGRPLRQGMDVLHSCPDGDNPLCVNPTHLREGTHEENMRDMARRGRRRVWGERARTAKLTEIQVLEIISRGHNGTPQRELAIEYGVTQFTISSILMGRSWKHLLPKPEPALALAELQRRMDANTENVSRR